MVKALCTIPKLIWPVRGFFCDELEAPPQMADHAKGEKTVAVRFGRVHNVYTGVLWVSL